MKPVAKHFAHLLLVFLALMATFTARPALAEDLVISAAASLTDAFTDVEAAFEAAHPGVDVILNFASSGALYRQMEQGAPLDVFASANPRWMDKAVENGFILPDDVLIFARNSLVLAVPSDNPAGVASLDDLTGDGVATIGIGTPETVPAGQYAQSALTAAGLYDTLSPKYIFAESVRQVLDYLTRGEVDCGFVYRTDAVKAGDAVLIVADIPLEKPVTYPVARVADTVQSELAQAFVDFVTGEQGLELLKARGFSQP